MVDTFTKWVGSQVLKIMHLVAIGTGAELLELELTIAWLIRKLSSKNHEILEKKAACSDINISWVIFNHEFSFDFGVAPCKFF